MRAESKSLTAGFVLLGIICLGTAVWWFLLRGQDRNNETDVPESAEVRNRETDRAENRAQKHAVSKVTDTPSGEMTQEENDRDSEKTETGGEEPDDKEQKRVDAFDDLTDVWREPAARRVSDQDIERFVEQFNQVPDDRKEECLHRALNLIPDENVELLAGILFDKSQKHDFIELVYNDILNRDEVVKGPILKMISKDREHPCWKDTAWILDVTGEHPQKQQQRKKK